MIVPADFAGDQKVYDFDMISGPLSLLHCLYFRLYSSMNEVRQECSKVVRACLGNHGD